MSVISRANPEADVVAELRRARSRAVAVLDQHWDSVLTLAKQLVRHNRITFDGCAHPAPALAPAAT